MAEVSWGFGKEFMQVKSGIAATLLLSGLVIAQTGTQTGPAGVLHLAWICTGHTRAYFFAKMTSDDAPALQFRFDQVLQSASVS